MNFEEAVKSRKKFLVADGSDNDAIVHYLCNGLTIKKTYRDGHVQEISISDILFLMHKELKLVEEKKTLSDKIEHILTEEFDRLKVIDVKEALKEFLTYISSATGCENYAMKKAKEIFGERLVN